jgi:hypothetical protein
MYQQWIVREDCEYRLRRRNVHKEKGNAHGKDGKEQENEACKGKETGRLCVFGLWKGHKNPLSFVFAHESRAGICV